MTEERNPEGWFVSLKDAKTGKINELMIARTLEAAEEWRSKGYIIRPFIYLSDADEKPRTCETCVNSRALWLDKVTCTNFDNLDGISVQIELPKDHYCKLWGPKDGGQTKTP